MNNKMNNKENNKQNNSVDHKVNKKVNNKVNKKQEEVEAKKDAFNKLVKNDSAFKKPAKMSKRTWKNITQKREQYIAKMNKRQEGLEVEAKKMDAFSELVKKDDVFKRPAKMSKRTWKIINKARNEFIARSNKDE